MAASSTGLTKRWVLTVLSAFLLLFALVGGAIGYYIVSNVQKSAQSVVGVMPSNGTINNLEAGVKSVGTQCVQYGPDLRNFSNAAQKLAKDFDGNSPQAQKSRSILALADGHVLK